MKNVIVHARRKRRIARVAVALTPLLLLLVSACQTTTTTTGTDDATTSSTIDATTSTTVTVTHTIHISEPSTPSTIRPLLGVNAGPLGVAFDATSVDLTNLYQQMAVTLVRTHDYNGPLDMATMYPDQTADPALESSYDFTASDAYYSAILAGGFEPYFRVGDSANNGSAYPTPSPRAPTNAAHWVAAAVHVVRHYNDAARWGRSPIRYVEIWNEPDAAPFWDSTRDAFFDLFAQSAIALKAAYPDLKIGGPGITSRAYKTPLGQAWFVALLDHCQAHGVPLDFFSWHTCTNDPESLVTAATWFRSQLDAHGYTATESHITEWNSDAASLRGTSPADALAVRNGARGAAITTASWIRLQEQGIALSTFYRGRDPQSDRGEYYGLISGTGQLKPSGLAFALWSQLANTYSTRLDVAIDTATGTTLYALAGRAADGSIAVLLANPATETLGCRLADYTASVDVRQVSDASTSTQHATLSPGGFEIPAYSIQLVITH